MTASANCFRDGTEHDVIDKVSASLELVTCSVTSLGHGWLTVILAGGGASINGTLLSSTLTSSALLSDGVSTTCSLDAFWLIDSCFISSVGFALLSPTVWPLILSPRWAWFQILPSSSTSEPFELLSVVDGMSGDFESHDSDFVSHDFEETWIFKVSSRIFCSSSFCLLSRSFWRFFLSRRNWVGVFFLRLTGDKGRKLCSNFGFDSVGVTCGRGEGGGPTSK